MPLTPGTQLGAYEIVAPLGAGGMGEVYRAHDTKLRREVAIKVLPAESLHDGTARARLLREARLAATLNHPSICTVHEVGEAGRHVYIAMELIEGQPLSAKIAERRTGLPTESVTRYGAQIAEALAHAHEKHVIHRDLKSSNVLVTADGRVKVLDFGVARRVWEAPEESEATFSQALTETGAIVGTPHYLAPEVLRGGTATERSDLWALGVLLHEMASGDLPFRGTTSFQLGLAILNDLPAELPERVLTGLRAVVGQCLAKEPGERYQRAVEVRAALDALRGDRAGHASRAEDATAARSTTPTRLAIRSLAVLPFENVSRDHAQEYFADGMTEALISELARLKTLRVISRTSAMRYKGVQRALPEIARELSVDAILEGSALLVGKRVRVSVQLVSARADETLWADRYDGEIEDVLDLQSRIAETVAKEIAVQATPREVMHLAKRRPVNPEAHVEYLKGRHTVAAASPQAIELGLRHFQRALELDPSYAPAWAGIAHCHMIRAGRGMAPAAEANEQARVAAMKALELDDSLAQAYSVLGGVAAQDMNLPEAIRHLERAIEMDPGSTGAYVTLGRLYYCSERHREAEEIMLKALSLDPLSMVIHTCVGDAYYYAREYERSVVYYQKAVEIDPRFDGAHTDLARSLETLGRLDEARREYEEGRRMSGGVAGPSFGLGHLEASSGNETAARRILQELIEARSHRVVSAWGIAALHASLRDVDEAFRWLDVAVDESATGLILLRVHPRLDPIRQDPRYPALLHRVGLDVV